MAKLFGIIAGIILVSSIMGVLILVPSVNENTSSYVTQGSISQVSTDEVFALDIALPQSPATAPVYKVIAADSISKGDPKLMDAKPSIPSEAEAPALAEKALEKYGGLPKDAILTGIECVSIKKYNTETGIVEAEYPQWTSVHYRQQINGSPTMGPGAGLTINLGENGELLGISKGWRTLEYAGEIPVITVQEAYEKLKNGETLTVYQSSRAGLRVSDIKLGYYAEDTNVDQKYYTPVWLFYATKDGKTTYPWPVDARR
ncbi:hypothetical protein [Methanoregula sp.]|uniref:hypothetical protein n=1 Tax=Methanoregula sp. TaxID=2052170 RepID=UPI0035647090